MCTWLKAWLERLACVVLITQLLMEKKQVPNTCCAKSWDQCLIFLYVAPGMQPVCQRVTKLKAVQQTGRSFTPVRKYDFWTSFILQKNVSFPNSCLCCASGVTTNPFHIEETDFLMLLCVLGMHQYLFARLSMNTFF